MTIEGGSRRQPPVSNSTPSQYQPALVHPTPHRWGPWMQVRGGNDSNSQVLIARSWDTVLGTLVLHFTPDELEAFCAEGVHQARLARAGILPP
jgi:hypothetical protein